jgi:predicted TIM-barrel fold metal-dependent hydrolase
MLTSVEVVWRQRAPRTAIDAHMHAFEGCALRWPNLASIKLPNTIPTREPHHPSSPLMTHGKRQLG